MDLNLKKSFLAKWESYFPGIDLPIAFYYTDDPGDTRRASLPTGRHCIICDLAIVRSGTSLAWIADTISCSGAKRYFGFSDKIRPNFEHFLSTGIPGKVEGERYIQTPELVEELMKHTKCIPVKEKYIVFKRFDKIEENETPVAVVFFAQPDVLSGLFTLCNFDHSDGNGVFSPFGSGCSSIVHHPYWENQKEKPRAVLGMFDVSARPCVPPNTLSFAIPMKKFEKIVGYMEETFLTTQSWRDVRKRLS
jgi:uncharacterized protein (DUF169 family)